MSLEKFSVRLQELMNKYNLLQSDISKIFQVSEPMITKYLKDKSIPSPDKIYLLSKKYNINPSWLMGYDVPMYNLPKELDVDLVEIPILGSIPAGIPVEAIEDIQGMQLIPRSEIKYPLNEYFCLKISGNSMYPKYLDGDIVLFHSQFEANSGQDICVYVNGYNATFKRLMLHDDGLELIAINPEYENKFYTKEECVELPVRIIGVATRLIRELD